MLLIRKRTLKN